METARCQASCDGRHVWKMQSRWWDRCIWCKAITKHQEGVGW